MFYAITYISKAYKVMADIDLNLLLQHSMASNELQNITGMLLYINSELLSHKEGRFIQAIEGPKQSVQALYAKIERDPRHFGVIKLSEVNLTSRNFSTWSMGFKAYRNDEFLTLPGGFDLTSDFLKYDESVAFNPSLDYLKQFYRFNTALRL